MSYKAHNLESGPHSVAIPFLHLHAKSKYPKIDPPSSWSGVAPNQNILLSPQEKDQIILNGAGVGVNSIFNDMPTFQDKGELPLSSYSLFYPPFACWFDLPETSGGSWENP